MPDLEYQLTTEPPSPEAAELADRLGDAICEVCQGYTYDDVSAAVLNVTMHVLLQCSQGDAERQHGLFTAAAGFFAELASQCTDA